MYWKSWRGVLGTLLVWGRVVSWIVCDVTGRSFEVVNYVWVWFGLCFGCLCSCGDDGPGFGSVHRGASFIGRLLRAAVIVLSLLRLFRLLLCWGLLVYRFRHLILALGLAALLRRFLWVVGGLIGMSVMCILLIRVACL